MKKVTTGFLLVTLLTTLLGCSTTEALTSNSDTSSIETTSNTKKHNLWAIEGKTNTVYLLGSIHLLKESHYPLPQAYMDAFDDAEQLVFEYDDATTNEEEIAAFTQHVGMYLDGSTLADRLDPETVNKIAEILPNTEVPPQLVSVMEPWLSFMTITVLEMMKLGYDEKYGIDQFFAKKAKEYNKPTSGLETAKQQIEILDSIPFDTQLAMLIDILENYDEAATGFAELDQAWVDADADILGGKMIDETKEFPAFYDLLVVKRNNDWINQIVPMLEINDDVLVIGGALHMYGEEGLVKQFQQLGYKVTQL